MSTFLELQDLVLDYLDDENAGYFTRDKVKQWVNYGQQEAQKLLIGAGENWYLECVQTTMVANQPLYALPYDFLKSHRVVIVDNPTLTTATETDLEPITLNQQDMIGNQAAYPIAFSLRKGCVGVYPKPDLTYTLRLYYSYRVTDMVYDHEVPDLPEQYHEVIAIIAALNGFIKDGRDASLLMKKLKDYTEMMKTDSEERVEDRPRMVVVSDDY